MSSEGDRGSGPGDVGPDTGHPIHDGERLPARREINAAEFETVIRRATELQLGADRVPERLNDAEVLRIGEEVGLDARHVRQALAELRAADLLPIRPRDTGLAARLWGEASVQASRVVPGDPHEVMRALEGYLRQRESLTRLRDQAGRQIWEPASDLASKLQRSLDLSGRGYELARARRIEVSVEGLEPGRSLVTLTADLGNQRAGRAAGWLIPASAIGLGAALGMHFGEAVPILLSMPAGLGPAAAAGSFAARRSYQRRRSRVETKIQGVLDRLEQGLSLRDGHTLREKLTDWWDGIVE